MQKKENYFTGKVMKEGRGKNLLSNEKGIDRLKEGERKSEKPDFGICHLGQIPGSYPPRSGLG